MYAELINLITTIVTILDGLTEMVRWFASKEQSQQRKRLRPYSWSTTSEPTELQWKSFLIATFGPMMKDLEYQQ
jgi:hypothetical protein